MKEYLPIVAVGAALYLLKKRAEKQAAGAVAVPKGPKLPVQSGITAGPKAGAVESVSPQETAATLDSLIYYAP